MIRLEKDIMGAKQLSLNICVLSLNQVKKYLDYFEIKCPNLPLSIVIDI